MKQYLIHIDSELGKKLELTSENFEYALVWDCRPKYLGVVRLQHRSLEGLRKFFEAAKNIYSTIVITAPNQDAKDMAQYYGYESYVDVAGLPYLSDENVKKLYRQHKKELSQKAKV